MFDWDEGDRFSFEDSERFEEDSLCSWMSEPESVCNNWRGWKKFNSSGIGFTFAAGSSASANKHKGMAQYGPNRAMSAEVFTLSQFFLSLLLVCQVLYCSLCESRSRLQAEQHYCTAEANLR